MRPGLRLKLLLSLGALLVLAFLPLFFAVARLTETSLASARESNARALGRAIAGHVAEARRHRTSEQLGPLVDAQLGRDGVTAIGLYDARGERLAAGVTGDDAALLPAQMARGEQVRTVHTDRGAAIVVVVPGGEGEGAVAAVLRTDASTIHASPLVRLVALYTGIVALGLLVFAYLAMTRLVVEPILALRRAAGRVAEGGRSFEVPPSNVEELADLGTSLAKMTEKLRADEDSLRGKVEALERATQDLAQAQARLVRSERLASVGRLAAGLAHEIGNPIAAILGFQELLIAGVDPSETGDFLERMKRETERVHRVLRDLLDFARPASPDRDGEPSAIVPGDPREAVADVLALVGPQKAFREVALTPEIAQHVPRVALDHGRLVQVILNLALNAVDAVPAQGGCILLRVAVERAEWVRIEVEDNGPGIATEIRDRLFEPFATTKEVGKGTGLGLAVCRGLVEAIGGTIAVDDGALGGARFILDLPVGAESGTKSARAPRDG